MSKVSMRKGGLRSKPNLIPEYCHHLEALEPYNEVFLAHHQKLESGNSLWKGQDQQPEEAKISLRFPR